MAPDARWPPGQYDRHHPCRIYMLHQFGKASPALHLSFHGLFLDARQGSCCKTECGL